MTDSTSPPRRPTILGPAELSGDDLALDDWARAAVSERLPRLRTVSTAWATAVSTITALFGAATVIDADSQVRALKAPWHVIYGILTAASLLCVAAGIALAFWGGQFRSETVPPDVEGRRELRKEVVARTDRDLKWSQIATAAAVVLLIASLAVRWYAPIR
jgi:hypothetical protein